MLVLVYSGLTGLLELSLSCNLIGMEGWQLLISAMADLSLLNLSSTTNSSSSTSIPTASCLTQVCVVCNILSSLSFCCQLIDLLCLLLCGIYYYLYPLPQTPLDTYRYFVGVYFVCLVQQFKRHEWKFLVVCFLHNMLIHICIEAQLLADGHGFCAVIHITCWI